MLKGTQLFFSYKRTTGEITWLQFKSRCVRIKQPTNTKQNSCFMLHRMQLQRDNNFSELHYKSVRENIEQRSTSCSTHHAASIGSYGPSSAIWAGTSDYIQLSDLVLQLAARQRAPENRAFHILLIERGSEGVVLWSGWIICPPDRGFLLFCCPVTDAEWCGQ